MESQLRGGCLREQVGGKLHGSLHVTLDLHLALHEQCVGLQLSFEETYGIFVSQAESGIGSAFLCLHSFSGTVLEIDSPDSGVGVTA